MFRKSPEKRFLMAAAAGDLATMDAMLFRGSICLNNCKTALYLAVTHNQFDSTLLLLEAGANPNIQNGDGNTPLIRAASQGYAEITRLLLEYGANPHIRNNNLSTAATCAQRNGQSATLSIINRFIAETEPVQPHIPATAEGAEEAAASATARANKPPAAVWHVTDDQEVARIAAKPALGKEITEIFNFRAERVITIIKDLAQNSETTLEKNFADVQNTAWLEEAAKAYETETGEAALFQSNTLQKTKPSLKPNKS